MIPRNKDGTYIVDPGGGGSGVEVLDQGVSLGTFTKINFVGSPVQAVDAGGGQANIIIGAYDTVEDEGIALPQRSTINFVGAGVTATDVGGKTVVTIPGGGSGVEVLDESVSLGLFTKLNFLGTSVSAVNAGGGQSNITVTAYNTVEDEGAPLPQRDTLNFVGAGVTATDVGGKTVVTIPGGVGSDSCQLNWGAASILVSTATRYLFPAGASGGTGGTAPVAAIQFRLFKSGTLKNLRVRHRTPGGNANIITYTVRINNVPTLISCSIAANNVGLNTQDLVNTAAAVAGDLVDIEVNKSGPIAGSPSDVTATLEWVTP